MKPVEGTRFERFGELTEIDPIQALIAGYENGIADVRETSFQAFIHGDQPVSAIGREVIARLAEKSPMIAAEFTFNLMAETQNSHFRDGMDGLRADECWDMAATSLPQSSDSATLELAQGFCLLMDSERSDRNMLSQSNNVVASALRNGCTPEVSRLLTHQVVKAFQSKDEWMVNQDRQRVENFTKGVGTIWRKDPEAAAKTQARIDAHKPGDHIIDIIKGNYSHSSLEDYEFSELLETTRFAGVIGSEEDQRYLTRILKGVLSRLDNDEVNRYIPEIIDTYLSSTPASQKALHSTLMRKLKLMGIGLVGDMDEQTLRETARKSRNARYQYEQPNPKYEKPSLPLDSQLFWPGDLVDVAVTEKYTDSSGRPVTVPERQVIEDIDHHVYGQPEDEEEKVYETAEGHSTSSDKLSLVERGELWKYSHGEITEFTDPITASNFATRTVDFKYVSKRDPFYQEGDDGSFRGKFEEWTKGTILEAIELGYADGFRLEGRILVSGRDIIAIKFNDPKIADLVANSTLVGFGRQTRA